MTDIEIANALFAEWWDAQYPQQPFGGLAKEAQARVLKEHALFLAGVAYGRAYADADPARVAELKAGA